MLLSQTKSAKKRDYSYNKRNTSNTPTICSTKWVLISITIFWFSFILYLLHRYKKDQIQQDITAANPLENKDNFIHSLHQQTATNADDINPFLFWGDRNFDTDTYLTHLSQELQNDPLLFDKCKAIMTDKHPRKNDIWSQAYQEWYLYHNFFYGKTKGIYLDIGAHKPLHLSNTAFFDKCLGWNGLCVEPTQTSLEFEGVRSCNVARKCVWSETKTLVMIYRSDGDASLVIDVKEQERIKRDVPDRVKDLFECEAICAEDLLNSYKVKNKYGEEIDIAVNVEIDFISLDVEGAEVEFLKCFPFHKYDIKVWSIEINKNEGLIDELMMKNGFMKFGYLSYFHSRLDAIYIKTPIAVQLPWVDKQEQEMWNKYSRCT